MANDDLSDCELAQGLAELTQGISPTKLANQIYAKARAEHEAAQALSN